jgi:hypothetical protein
MEGVLRMILHTAPAAEKTNTDETRQKQAILDEIKEVSRQISCVDRWFEMESDSDLIDACIYQREALHAKYRYLLQKARRQSLTAPMFSKTTCE